MPTRSPGPITAAELLARQERVADIAEAFGFVGIIEYQHVYSQTGGAQYGRAAVEDNDRFTVYAEAFERDADPEDYSLAAIIAHERGHQILARHPRIAKRIVPVSLVSEEILASLLGMLICKAEKDREMLYGKAAFELLARGQSPENVRRQLKNLCEAMETLL
jgi:hypothetical protein